MDQTAYTSDDDWGCVLDDQGATFRAHLFWPHNDAMECDPYNGYDIVHSNADAPWGERLTFFIYRIEAPF